MIVNALNPSNQNGRSYQTNTCELASFLGIVKLTRNDLLLGKKVQAFCPSQAFVRDTERSILVYDTGKRTLVD